MATITSSQTQIYAKPRHQFMPSWMPRSQHGHHKQQFTQSQLGGGQVITAMPVEFDGKRLRKPVARKTVDYNASIHEWLQTRLWQRDHRDLPALQPDAAYSLRLGPPLSMQHNPVNTVTTKFVRAATNKMKCPVFCVTWTPEGRRLITGASSGEFTLWNGLTFNFETILQAHDLPVRCMTWSNNDHWMVTGDHGGYIKYWQTNMNNVRMFQGHKEAVRGISFCPTDIKFTSCSDDGTVRVWDFTRCYEERILRGHGSDVKCVDWHPQKSLIVSGSKDSQQPIKLWCPKSGQSVATIHAHKSTVMDARWNKNGNWLLTASRDHLIKLFDVRKLNVELQTFRGHKREACTLGWHPIHEELFASGGSDGSVMFWMVGTDKEVGSMETAHESCVWSLAWHPNGHILCTGSNDHTSKFWTRNRPGDKMRDRYNLNTLPRGMDDLEDDIPTGDRNHGQDPYIPGMGIDPEQLERLREEGIPGLDDDRPTKKTPHSKPIHRGFQQQWMENRGPMPYQDGDGPPLKNNLHHDHGENNNHHHHHHPHQHHHHQHHLQQQQHHHHHQNQHGHQHSDMGHQMMMRDVEMRMSGAGGGGGGNDRGSREDRRMLHSGQRQQMHPQQGGWIDGNSQYIGPATMGYPMAPPPSFMTPGAGNVVVPAVAAAAAAVGGSVGVVAAGGGHQYEQWGGNDGNGGAGGHMNDGQWMSQTGDQGWDNNGGANEWMHGNNRPPQWNNGGNHNAPGPMWRGRGRNNNNNRNRGPRRNGGNNNSGGTWR